MAFEQPEKARRPENEVVGRDYGALPKYSKARSTPWTDGFRGDSSGIIYCSLLFIPWVWYAWRNQLLSPEPPSLLLAALQALYRSLGKGCRRRCSRRKRVPIRLGSHTTEASGSERYQISRGQCIRWLALITADLDSRSAPPCRLTVTEEPRSAVEHQNHGRWINGMLRDLNIHSNSPTFSLTHIAADDKLLLSHTQQDLIEKLAQHATLPQAAYMFDSSTFLISRLEKLQLDKVKKWADADADCKRLKEDAYIANLLHLLRRLQYLLFQVLVHRSISCLDEFASHWQTYWQQQKKLGEDWFTEWPSGRRPLSTTWPWNIRPSLVVLWGVCWMFYRSDQNNEDNPRSPAQQLVDESANWQLIFTGPELEQGTSDLCLSNSTPTISNRSFDYSSRFPSKPVT